MKQAQVMLLSFRWKMLFMCDYDFRKSNFELLGDFFPYKLNLLSANQNKLVLPDKGDRKMI